MIEIKNRFTLEVIYTSPDATTVKDAAIEAVVKCADLSGANLRDANLSGADLRDADLSGADLRGADLSGAYLRGADLRSADLRGADLRGAYLSGANLRDANLRGADLSDADLRGADLRSADLRGAYLRGAYLSGANLSDANLRDANLSDADLRGANLSDFKNDFWEILIHAPGEIAGLRAALIEGRVNGSTYRGECACLVGTIANCRHVAHNQLAGITPNADRPAEQWFMSIKTGDTPETNQISKISVEWLDEFVELSQQFALVGTTVGGGVAQA